MCGAAETGDQVGKQAAEPQKIKYHEREAEHHVDNAQHCTRSRGGTLAPAACIALPHSVVTLHWAGAELLK